MLDNAIFAQSDPLPCLNSESNTLSLHGANYWSLFIS